MKTISLTQGQTATVDDWNYDDLIKYRWFAVWSPITKSYYAARRIRVGPYKQKTLWMHRVISKTPDHLLCDHINHDTLFNVEENLRNVTNSQNSMNKRIRSDNLLRIRNISRHGEGFRVTISKEGRKVFNKTYRTLEEAIEVRNNVIDLYHGDFSYREPVNKI